MSGNLWLNNIQKSDITSRLFYLNKGFEKPEVVYISYVYISVKVDREKRVSCIVLFITQNHTVHRFNVFTRNIIQIENHEYVYIK